MKRFAILIPVYNDWQSLAKLLTEINTNIKEIEECEFDCIIVNDASTIPVPEIKVPSNIKSIELINMKKNRGHARCNATGLKYLTENESFDYVILMDGDGEDRPEELSLLFDKSNTNPLKTVTANRINRSEGFFFKFLCVCVCLSGFRFLIIYSIRKSYLFIWLDDMTILIDFFFNSDFFSI